MRQTCFKADPKSAWWTAPHSYRLSQSMPIFQTAGCNSLWDGPASKQISNQHHGQHLILKWKTVGERAALKLNWPWIRTRDSSSFPNNSLDCCMRNWRRTDHLQSWSQISTMETPNFQMDCQRELNQALTRVSTTDCISYSYNLTPPNRISSSPMAQGAMHRL